MNDLKIYGTARSRTVRVLWMAHELGLAFEHIPTKIARQPNPTARNYFAEGETHTPEFLALNPNGRIPVIDDGGAVVWESMAINLYLARKHGGGLWPDSVAGEGHAFQWSFWAMTEAEGPLFRYLLHKTFLPEAERDQDAASEAEATLGDRIAILERALEECDYLLGNAFSVADLNLASVLAWLGLGPFDLSGHPAVKAWLERCLARPAYGKAVAMGR